MLFLVLYKIEWHRTHWTNLDVAFLFAVRGFHLGAMVGQALVIGSPPKPLARHLGGR